MANNYSEKAENKQCQHNNDLIESHDQKLLANYRNHLREKPQLRFLFFEVTNSCNLSCLHCGSNSSPNNKCFLDYEIISKVLLSVAKNYNSKGIMICLSGGEPLLHPRIFDIIKFATDLGFPCGITTNGILIDDAVAKKLLSSGIGSVTFSLDGLEKSHNYLRNNVFSYRKTLIGIRNFTRAASNKSAVTQITTVVNRKNISELDELYKVICEAGVDSWKIVNLDPIGRALDNIELLLQPEDYVYLLEYIQNKRFSKDVKIDVTYGCSHYLPLKYERKVRDTYFICGSGIYVASILCNGDIYSCLDIERRDKLIQGNVYKDNFTDVWENKFLEFRCDRTETSSLCFGCPDRIMCNGDSTHTWDFDSCNPKICLKKIIGETYNE